jgi:hypothetical protein
MKIFYWVMGLLVLGTLLPSILFMALYAATGRPEAAGRARGFWAYSKVFALLGFNILVWGHVAVGLWNIWFH